MSLVVVILYEDQRAVAAKRYAPHDLVLACVADQVGKRLWDIDNLAKPYPLKGAGNMKTALRSDLGPRGEPVFAVFDRDKIGDASAFPGCGACHTTIRATIHPNVAPPMANRFTAVLLKENMETVIEACCAAAGRPNPAKKPRPRERDQLIATVAYDDSRKSRDAVLSNVDSLDYLVKKLVPLFI